ncbi:unnamed protein product [Adineta ricciae]|uniref:Uncharacterized protein n=1 Tax=Adineta ricciae TaxID=249248 RepID=A0A814AMC6_ADIRI|nr:unnamed protein product [Adineta ricciae]
MSDRVAFGCTAPLCLFDGEPYIIVYDPGKRVQIRRKDLAPFESILDIFHNEKEWTNALNIATERSWSILLIFPHQTEIQITTFVTRHVLNRSQLHSIYLILRDEVRCNAQLTNMLQSQLYWCRPLTTELSRDFILSHRYIVYYVVLTNDECYQCVPSVKIVSVIKSQTKF